MTPPSVVTHAVLSSSQSAEEREISQIPTLLTFTIQSVYLSPYSFLFLFYLRESAPLILKSIIFFIFSVKFVFHLQKNVVDRKVCSKVIKRFLAWGLVVVEETGFSLQDSILPPPTHLLLLLFLPIFVLMAPLIPTSLSRFKPLFHRSAFLPNKFTIFLLNFTFLLFHLFIVFYSQIFDSFIFFICEFVKCFIFGLTWLIWIFNTQPVAVFIYLCVRYCAEK